MTFGDYTHAANLQTVYQPHWERANDGPCSNLLDQIYYTAPQFMGAPLLRGYCIWLAPDIARQCGSHARYPGEYSQQNPGWDGWLRHKPMLPTCGVVVSPQCAVQVGYGKASPVRYPQQFRSVYVQTCTQGIPIHQCGAMGTCRVITQLRPCQINVTFHGSADSVFWKNRKIINYVSTHNARVRSDVDIEYKQ